MSRTSKAVSFWDESPEEAMTSNGYQFVADNATTESRDSDSPTNTPYEFGRWNGRYGISQLNLKGEK
jgi:hypothetical protein